MKEKSCGAIIINDNKVLLVKQTSNTINFPKGHVENNETEIETAIREVKEETNLDIKILPEYRYVNSYIMDNNVQKDVIFFLAIPQSFNIVKQEKEISDIFWCDIDKVVNHLQFENQHELWNKVIKDIKKIFRYIYNKDKKI